MIRDEIIDVLSENGYTSSDVELIKIRLSGYYNRKNKYDYIGSNLNEVENLKYDNGYGSQELFGYVWLKDGSWLERHEYDGSEWWVLYHPSGPDKNIDLNIFS